MILRPTGSTLFPYTTLSDLVTVGLERAESVQESCDKAAAIAVPDDSHFGLLDMELSDVLTEDEVSDRKSTRLNSSHVKISYAVFCLKKKNERCVDDHLAILR